MAAENKSIRSTPTLEPLARPKRPCRVWGLRYNVSVRITVKFFAILKDRAGTDHTVLDLAGGSTVDHALQSIKGCYPNVTKDLARSAVAVNRNYVKGGTVLQDGDELALIPPVSGG